jgi:tetratricopeptide (TPR) repeat protein
VVEVPPDQEPRDKEEIASPLDADKREEAAKESKEGESIVAKESKEGEKERKGPEFDKWLVDFAHLFQTHLGVDPNGHVELQDRGMELVAEALEEVVSGEKEAHKLFAAAMEKFKEVVVLGYVNWGNVYMCMARKQFKASSSHGEGEGEAEAEAGDDDGDEGIDFCARLQASFDWAQSQYELAKEKFEQSLLVKPDSIDALLGLGQKEFESAKLHWSLAVASRADLRTWDSSKMLELFGNAEKMMERAAEIVSKQESEQLQQQLQQTIAMAVEVVEGRIGEKNDHGGSNRDQDLAIKPQIYLFWGNILYERSQVEFRLQMPSWKQLLDDAVNRFEVAGASPSDIATALETHLSSSLGFSSFADAETQDQGLTMASNCSSSGFSSFVVDAETQDEGLTMASHGSSLGFSSFTDAETQAQGLTIASNGSSLGLSSFADAETQEQGSTMASNGSSSGFSSFADAETQDHGTVVASKGDGITDEASSAGIELPAVSGKEMHSRSIVVGDEYANGVIVGSSDNNPSLISSDAGVLERYDDDDVEDHELIQGCCFQRQTEMPQLAALPDDTRSDR